MEKRGIRTRTARRAVNTSLQARLPQSLRASCPHATRARPCASSLRQTVLPPGSGATSTLAEGGGLRTGTVDSREKVTPGTGREAGPGQAVVERTGKYSQRVPVCGPTPAIPTACVVRLSFRENQVKLYND